MPLNGPNLRKPSNIVQHVCLQKKLLPGSLEKRFPPAVINLHHLRHLRLSCVNPFPKKSRQMQITGRDTGRTICLHLSAPEEEESSPETLHKHHKSKALWVHVQPEFLNPQLPANYLEKKTGFGAKALKPPIDQTVRRSLLNFINTV